MTDEEIAFNKIVDKLTESKGVTAGKMMSSPGICTKGKVFAFFWNNKMIFKLRKDRNLEAEFGIEEYEFLNPFKNKPPMKGWYVVDHTYSSKWEKLAIVALEQMK